MKVIPCPVSKEELQAMYVEMNDVQIADKLREQYDWVVPKHVRRWRNRYGIESLKRYSRNSYQPIEGGLRSLLIGSMLGDARITRLPNTARFTEGHCLAQKEYMEWKAKQWGDWASGPLYRSVTGKSPVTGRVFETWWFRTHAHAVLIPYHDLFYAGTKGYKRIHPDIVDEVDDFALTIWYLDDGNNGWWPSITFGADERSRENAFRIFRRFNLNPHWVPRNGDTGIFDFRDSDADRFMDIVRPHIPDCMAYKRRCGYEESKRRKVHLACDWGVIRLMLDSGDPIKKISRKLSISESTLHRKVDFFRGESMKKYSPTEWAGMENDAKAILVRGMVRDTCKMPFPEYSDAQIRSNVEHYGRFPAKILSLYADDNLRTLWKSTGHIETRVRYCLDNGLTPNWENQLVAMFGNLTLDQTLPLYRRAGFGSTIWDDRVTHGVSVVAAFHTKTTLYGPESDGDARLASILSVSYTPGVPHYADLVITDSDVSVNHVKVLPIGGRIVYGGRISEEAKAFVRDCGRHLEYMVCERSV